MTELNQAASSPNESSTNDSIPNEFVAAPTPVDTGRDWRQGWRDLVLEYPEVTPRTVQTPVEASFHQRRLWFLAQMESGSAAYHVPLAWRIRGGESADLDPALLRGCLEEVVALHESLRTTFAMQDGTLLQRVHPENRIEWRSFDVSSVPAMEGEREVELQRRLDEDLARVFDLVQGPLIRACLVRVGAHEYVFLLTIHHIVFDGPSTEVLANELSQMYRSGIANPSASLLPLPRLPVQYPDFAVWQRDRFHDQGESLEKQLNFWSEELRELPPPLDLAPAANREPHTNFRGSQLGCVLDLRLTMEFEALARASGVTLFMALLAVYQTLLFRYTGESDFVIGCPIANRNRAELRNLIGFFANTLAIRSSCQGDPTFRQLLRRVRERGLAAFANQEVPFDAVVERIHPERQAGVNPVFQTMFSLELPNWRLLKLPGLVCEELPVHNGFSKFDLVCVTALRSDGLHLSIEYGQSRFDERSVRAMMEHFGNLMKAAVANPDQPLSQMKMLGLAELRLVTADWNQTRLELPNFASIPAMLAAQVAKSPEQVALSDDGGSLTYQEMSARADAMARRLQELGVGRAQRVGVCADASVDTIVALMAILKAGGTYVFLDPEHPEERLQFMIADAEIRVIVGPQVQHKLPSFSGERVWFDEVPAAPEVCVSRLEVPSISDLTMDDAAYVVYTSGSTGRPKGVEALHRGVINRCAWMWHQYPRGAEEVCCIRTSLNFVDSIREIFGALLWGVRAVVASPRQSRNVDELADLVTRERVTRLALVPSMLRAMLELRDSAERLGCVRYWLAGGEALEPNLVELFQRTLPHAVLLNLYGSSEDAGDVTCCDLRESRFGSVVPIGRPIANTQVYVLDANLNPVPVGVRGNLYVGGAGIERGYLNQPEMTAARFVPSPFATPNLNLKLYAELPSPSHSTRLFHTGDLARWLPDGQVEYLGRADSQVKIRGFRVELEEVESALRALPIVKDAIVVNRQTKSGHQLVGYLVLRDSANRGSDSSSASARDFLAEIQKSLRISLPDYMVPSAFVWMQQLPLTPTGKVNRRALPPPESGDWSAAQVDSSPTTGTEAAIVAVWQELLAVERVQLNSNFFDLGGHSLLLVRVQRQLADSLHVHISLNDLFRYPTIRALADFLSGAQPELQGLEKARSAGERQKRAMQHRNGKRKLESRRP